MISTAKKIMEKLEAPVYQIGKCDFDFKFAYVMGILNITNDSFSDGGDFIDKDRAVEHALEMIDQGSDIIDVGGESTRPGSEPINEEEELNRVIPVINQILKTKPETIISIDTTKANVAEEALKNGASMVNDIGGGTFDPRIFEVVSKYNSALVLMHIKGKPKTMQDSPVYSDVVPEVYEYLQRQSSIASGLGINKIIIDPGIGFGKRIEHNLELVSHLNEFKTLGFPILIGLSRKSFIGEILDLRVNERDEATNSMNMLALSKGARIVRTHNAVQGVQTCKLFNKLILS